MLCQLSLSAFGLLLLCKQAATSLSRPTMFGYYNPYVRTKMYLAEVCVASFYSLYLFFFILSGLVAALLTDKSFDKKHHLRNCPNLILYRNKVPVAYDGGL